MTCQTCDDTRLAPTSDGRTVPCFTCEPHAFECDECHGEGGTTRIEHHNGRDVEIVEACSKCDGQRYDDRGDDDLYGRLNESLRERMVRLYGFDEAEAA